MDFRTYREGGRKLCIGQVGETEKGESGEEEFHLERVVSRDAFELLSLEGISDL
jgi:hypothetical protein